MTPLIAAVLVGLAVGLLVFVLEAFVFTIAAPALGAVVLGVIAAGIFLIQSNDRTKL